MVNIAGVICNDAEFQRALENEQMSRYEKTLLFDEVVNGIEINNLYDMGGIKITCFDADNNVYANWGTNYNNYQFLFEQPWVQSSIGKNGYVQWNMFGAVLCAGGERGRQLYFAGQVADVSVRRTAAGDGDRESGAGISEPA